MSVLRRVKLRTSDGTESIEYPLGVSVENVEVANKENLSQRLERIDEDLEKNEEDIAAVNEMAGTNRQNIGTAEIRIDALERRSASVDKKPYYFDTVADMKAYQGLIEGDMVITLGYYEVNDGGGAEYNIVSESSDYIETLNNNLKAELILKNSFVNPLQFGAIADGTTDNATLLNSLLTKYNNLNITGDFKINSSLILNDNAILIGDNKHHIILPDDSGVCVNIDGNNVLIKDLKIKSTTTDYENNTRCIEITSSLNCVIENCELYNAYNGIKIDPENNDTVGNLKIHNNNIHTIKAGIYFGNADETISFTISNIYITNNNIHDGVGVVDPSSLNNGIKLSRLTKQVTIDNNIIHDMKADGIDGFKSGDTLQITNNQIYNNGESAIELKDSTSYDDTLWGRAKNCVISNNIFYGHSYVDVNLNGTPYVVTTEEYKQYQNTIIQNNIFKTGNIGIKVSASNVTICNNIINLYDYAIQLYDSYGIDTTYKNIDIYGNIINDASIRVTGANYYAHIYNNSMKFTTDSKSPIWNASPNVIIGDNNILCEQLPYVKSSAHIVRETDRFVMIPFKFENITEQTILKQLAIPKSNKRIQIVGAYILSNSDISSDNLSANIKFDDNVNQMYSQTNTTFTAGTKNPMRPFTSTYSAESNVDTYVNIYASTDVSGYMVIYYAFA